MRNGFKVFDSDMHIMEPPDLWERYIDPEYRLLAPRGVVSENVRDLRMTFPDEQAVDEARRSFPPNRLPRGHNFERNQRLYADHSSRGWAPDCQIEAMDLEGIDVAVLYPSRGLHAQVNPNRDPRLAAAIARAYNDWLYEFCQSDTKRLLGSGMISVFNIDDAVNEAERAVRELGFKAVFLRANVVNGRCWHDPYYEPLWDALEDLGVPLGFHEALSGGVKQAGENFAPNTGLRRIYGQPFENMLAVASFCCGGILERHPKLKVAFLEANCSWVPWLVWRMDEHQELEGDVFMTELTMRPSDYFRRQCYVSVEPDETPVQHMIKEYGADQIVFSTDYPHGDSRYPEAVNSFMKLELTDDQRKKILWDNCASFYSVD